MQNENIEEKILLCGFHQKKNRAAKQKSGAKWRSVEKNM